MPLPELAESLGIRAAFIKDESTRFGLKSFKGLGGSYAVFRAVCPLAWPILLRQADVSSSSNQIPR